MVDRLVIALALVPAILWGFSPVLEKRGMAAGGSALQGALIVVIVDSLLYTIAILTRQGLDLFTNVSVQAVLVFGGAGVVGTALGRLAVFSGVDKVGASINSAGISTRPLFASVLAAVLLGERVTVVTLLGILILVLGLVVLTTSKGGDLRGWQPIHILYPLAAAAAFGLGNVMRRFGLETFPETTLLEAVALNEVAALVVLLSYAVIAHRDDLRTAPRATYGYFAASGTVTAVALLSLYAALDRGTVVIVDPISATAPLFTTVFAEVLLSDLERVTRGVVLGAALVVAGAIIITTV